MARYDPLPYVRETRPRNLRLADLYLRQGEQQAESERRRGEIAAQLWSRVGDSVGQAGAAIAMAPQQERERQAKEAAAAQETKLRGMQVSEAERQINDRENFDLAMSAGSRQKTLEALKSRPELYEKAQQHFTNIDTSMKKLLGDAAAGIADFGYTPEAAMAAMDDLLDQGFDEKKIEPFRAAIQKNPAAVKQIVTSLLSQSPDPRHQAMAKPQLTEVSPGASLVDPRNPSEAVFTAPNRTVAPKSLQSKDVLLDGQPAMVNFNPADGTYSVKGEDVTARVKPIPPTKQPPTVRYQPREVLGDDGKPTIANYDALTGDHIDTKTGQKIRAPKPVPSAMEQMDSRKFQKASPVLKGIGELSERINTLQGVYAKAVGEKKKLEAKVNLDDDVAEYESIVSMFTPMVARALGHTGVLTEQDVQSVKEGFPKPGDSKTLRDRKMKRLLGIIGELESTEGVVNDPSVPRPGDTEYDMNGKPITRKPK